MSNYFPKYSHDGKWLVFCKAENYMLLQTDSKLYIMPADLSEEPRLMNCNMNRLNSWHSWSPNSRWLVFSSKVNSPYTELFLTHIDEEGNDTPPILLSNFSSTDRACNIPEFVDIEQDGIKLMQETFVDYHTYISQGANLITFEQFKEASEAIKESIEMNPLYRAFSHYSQRFQDLKVASTTYVHADIVGTGENQDITKGISNPDVPRNISITTTNNAAPSGNVTITGIDAKGNSATEKITISAGAIAYGSKAFATVSMITIPAGVSSSDKVSVGISDKLGLYNVIYAASDVYKKTKNDLEVSIGTVDITNDTVDCSTITSSDVITIYYRLKSQHY